MTKGKGTKPPIGSGARARRAPPPQRPPIKLIAIIAVVAVVVVGGFIALSAMGAPAAPAPVAGLITGTGTKGPAEAKVTVTEYSDFQ